MDHEHDKHRNHSRAAAATDNDAVEPGQSSRSALLHKPERPVASGLVQRRGNAAGEPDTSEVHAAAAQGVATASSQLPYLDTIQRAFGRHDISSVQAHTGPEAAASARAMGAQAFATGNHVVLGSGTDLRTVAHEAAHIVQQRGGVQLKGGVGEAGDEYESHADRVADKVDRGESAESLLDEKAPRDEIERGGSEVMQRKAAHGTSWGCSGCGPLQLSGQSSTTRSGRRTESPYTNAAAAAANAPFRAGTRAHSQHAAGATNSTPAAPPAPKELWDGTRDKLSWYPGVRDGVLQQAERPQANGGILYECMKCVAGKKVTTLFPRDKIQVDHKKDWKLYVLEETSEMEYEFNGHRWKGTLLEDAKQAYNDVRNLQPMCSSCNGTKSGPKHYDNSGYIKYLGPVDS